MNDLCEWLENQNGGTGTYAEFQQRAHKLARQDGENAALWMLLAGIAGRFVARFDGEPLAVDNANTAIRAMRDLVAEARGFLTSSESDRLAFVNRLATFDLPGVKPA